jgi:hypothetical protein
VKTVYLPQVQPNVIFASFSDTRCRPTSWCHFGRSSATSYREAASRREALSAQYYSAPCSLQRPITFNRKAEARPRDHLVETCGYPFASFVGGGRRSVTQHRRPRTDSSQQSSRERARGPRLSGSCAPPRIRGDWVDIGAGHEHHIRRSFGPLDRNQPGSDRSTGSKFPYPSALSTVKSS